jgi:cytochrome P450
MSHVRVAQALAVAPGMPRKAPIYAGLPGVGPLFEMRRDYIGFVERATRLGDVVRIELGPVVAHLLNHPRHVGHVLVEHHKNYAKQTRGYAALRRVLGNGLVTSEGAFWQRQRRIANPAFKRTHLAVFDQTFVRAARDLVERRWAGWIARGEPFDVAAEMTRVTLRAVGETLLSTDPSGEADAVGGALGEVLHQSFDRITSLAAPDWLPTPANVRFKKARAQLDRIVLGLIADRRRDAAAHDDLLSALVHAKDEETGEAMTDEQLRDEVMTLFLAGHETTANNLAWTFWLLGRNPAVEHKARAELQAVLGDRDATAADLPRLPYLRAVVQESMRLYPPVWILARSAVEPDTIDGYDVPAGSYVFMSAWTLHRRPDFWRDPEAFDPDRWLTDDGGEAKLGHRYQYLPFSVGARKCIGDGFAMVEAQLMLATILRRVHLELVPLLKVELEPVITLRPKHGVQAVARAVTGFAPDAAAIAESTELVCKVEPEVASKCPFH